MTEREETPAEARAKGKDVDGLKTLPGVHSPSGEEKAGTGEDLGDEGDDPEQAHAASDTYPRHRPVGGPPDRVH
ncbi:hypothetical protein [Frondihabitans cladoniiphilus]|uniref:Uncharacterized protein n=1 Tax=Frondihabitans cladoniiphilus TaxID=715785 RepID=A0ABP8VSC2_9MICO